MAKEICISSTPHETRLAILEDDQLAEIYYERENEYTLAGSIYNGRVTRVLPGMQSAFVDLGLERDAFLYVTDFMELEDQEETDELEKAAVSGGNQPPREVRHTNGQDRSGQDRGQRGGRPDQRQERESRPTMEITSDSDDAVFAAPGEMAEDGDATSGIRRTRREAVARTPASSRKAVAAAQFQAAPAESQEFIETHVNESRRARNRSPRLARSGRRPLLRALQMDGTGARALCVAGRIAQEVRRRSGGVSGKADI